MYFAILKFLFHTTCVTAQKSVGNSFYGHSTVTAYLNTEPFTWSNENSKYYNYDRHNWKDVKNSGNDERRMLSGLVAPIGANANSYEFDNKPTTLQTNFGGIYSEAIRFGNIIPKSTAKNYGLAVLTVWGSVEVLVPTDKIMKYENVTEKTNYLHKELMMMLKTDQARKDNRAPWLEDFPTTAIEPEIITENPNAIKIEKIMVQRKTGIFCTFLRELLKITALKEEPRHRNIYYALEILLAMRLGQDKSLAGIEAALVMKIHILTHKLANTDQFTLGSLANDSISKLHNCGPDIIYGTAVYNVIQDMEKLFTVMDLNDLNAFLEAYKDYPRPRMRAAAIADLFINRVLMKLLSSQQRDKLLNDINQILTVNNHGEWRRARNEKSLKSSRSVIRTRLTYITRNSKRLF